MIDAGSGTPNQYVSNSTGWLVWLEVLSGGKFRAIQSLCKGVAGNSTAQMLARYATDIAPYYDQFDILIVEGGVNDYANGITYA